MCLLHRCGINMQWNKEFCIVVFILHVLLLVLYLTLDTNIC